MISPPQGSSASGPRRCMVKAVDFSFDATKVIHGAAIVAGETPDCLNYPEAGSAKTPKGMPCELETLSRY